MNKLQQIRIAVDKALEAQGLESTSKLKDHAYVFQIKKGKNIGKWFHSYIDNEGKNQHSKIFNSAEMGFNECRTQIIKNAEIKTTLTEALKEVHGGGNGRRILTQLLEDI